MQVSAGSEFAEADNARESHALAFRIAFAAGVGLTLQSDTSKKPSGVDGGSESTRRNVSDMNSGGAICAP
jgi:hypothetical protein